MPGVFTFNLQTKFEMSSFIRWKDMAWTQKCRNGSRDNVHAHLEDSQITQGLTLPAAKCNTKFEVSGFSRSIDISGSVKFQNVSRVPNHAHLGDS